MASGGLSLNLTDIQKNIEFIDSEALHLFLIEKVESGEYETCLEALAAYVEETDLDLDTPALIKKFISPSLKEILYKEAMEKSLLKERMNSISVDDFF